METPGRADPFTSLNTARSFYGAVIWVDRREAELVLDIGAGSPGGWLSDHVLEEEFPRAGRHQVIDREVTFPVTKG